MNNINKDIHAFKSLMRFAYLLLRDRSKLNDNFDNNYRVCQNIGIDVVEGLNIDFKVIGSENIPMDEPTLIASNHKGLIDILILLKSIERTTSFVAAKSLFANPLLKKYLESIKCVSVDINSFNNLEVMKKQINEMYHAIQLGCSVVFPEGKAHHFDNEIGEFKKTAFLCSIKSDSYILPTYIDLGDTRSFIKWVIPQEKIRLHFGKAFKPSDISDKRMKPQELSEYTREQVLLLKQQADSNYK